MGKRMSEVFNSIPFSERLVAVQQQIVLEQSNSTLKVEAILVCDLFSMTGTSNQL